jgi:hypothetical protein
MYTMHISQPHKNQLEVGTLKGRVGLEPLLLARRHCNIAACALANKNARIVWALLTHDRDYESAYATAHAA